MVSSGPASRILRNQHHWLARIVQRLTIFNSGGYGSGHRSRGALCLSDEVSRWRRPGRGLRSPDEESNGYASDLRLGRNFHREGHYRGKVMALKARKARLFSSVLDDGDVFGTALGVDDIRRLLA
jgi:hypothetical protein